MAPPKAASPLSSIDTGQAVIRWSPSRATARLFTLRVFLGDPGHHHEPRLSPLPGACLKAERVEYPFHRERVPAVASFLLSDR
jgi:hypothetical protein